MVGKFADMYSASYGRWLVSAQAHEIQSFLDNHALLYSCKSYFYTCTCIYSMCLTSKLISLSYTWVDSKYTLMVTAAVIRKQ